MGRQIFRCTYRLSFVPSVLVLVSCLWGCGDASPACLHENNSSVELIMDSAFEMELPLETTPHCFDNTLDIVNREVPGRGQFGGVQGTLSIKAPCFAIEGDNYLTVNGDPRGWVILESGSDSVELLSLIEMYLLNSTADLSKLQFGWSKRIENFLPNVPGSEMLIRYGCLASTHSTLPQPHRVDLRWLIVPPVGDVTVRAEFHFSCDSEI
jgi:hypothetical protein